MIFWNPAKAALDTDELLASNEISFHSSHHPSCFGLSTGFLPYKCSVGFLNKLPDSESAAFHCPGSCAVRGFLLLSHRSRSRTLTLTQIDPRGAVINNLPPPRSRTSQLQPSLLRRCA
jgi:hypothetical protein